MIFTRILLFVFLLLSSQYAQAENQLKITSPADGTVVVPGQVIRITMQQKSDLPSLYFNGFMGLSPSAIIGEQKPISLDPYIIEVEIQNAPPGKYLIVGMAGRTGNFPIEKSAPLMLVINPKDNPDSIKHLKFSDSHIYLRFRGETGGSELLVDYLDGHSASIPKDMLSRIKWSINDPTIVSLNSDGSVTALKSGTTYLSASIDGMHAVLDVQVEAGSGLAGDFNGDFLIDIADIMTIKSSLNQPSTIQNDARDLNNDSKIDILDIELLRNHCTYPQCAPTKP